MTRFFRTLKTKTLLATMSIFALVPGLGKHAKHRASHIHFRREPVKFFGLHGFE